MAARSSGILLHPTSLPGAYGIGDLGPEALRFLAQLQRAGQTVWQMLPLGPTGSLHSPYDCRSAFAGSELLISPRKLVEDGLLAHTELRDLPSMAADRVDPRARDLKSGLLRSAWSTYPGAASSSLRRHHEDFVGAPEQRDWLDDWALYAALREHYRLRSWTEWPPGLRDRHPDELARAQHELVDEIDFHRFVQFLFFRQWRELRSRADHHGIRLCGDLPIYVAHDSADVWAHRELFDLGSDGRPRTVAGVPPDAFSADGQRWGNPTYRWPVHRRLGYRWWRRRLETNLELFDLLRVDHFRGFVAFWQVPAEASNARTGRWVRGPGQALFRALSKIDGVVRDPLPLIAEDLGHITPSVRRLRRQLGLPGMRVLQFAFDDPESEHRPDRIPTDTVVYTGTHDNDTTRGWYGNLEPERRLQVAGALGLDPEASEIAVVRRLLEAAFESRAELAIVPLQDVLELGSEARMNLPGTVEGNWLWRAPNSLLDESAGDRLRAMTERSDRLGGQRPGDHR